MCGDCTLHKLGRNGGRWWQCERERECGIVFQRLEVRPDSREACRAGREGRRGGWGLVEDNAAKPSSLSKLHQPPPRWVVGGEQVQTGHYDINANAQSPTPEWH
uniref:Uncharacterized protein n=1 Tax=Ananas comosus var. bracteatus TaxID=296719 RepID=A0A6V7P544_ANACO|nr:unnamed protein product [Ananas comosus var. bracteatus]